MTEESHGMSVFDRTIIEADARGRISLAKFGIKNTQLVAESTGDGGVILHPAVVLTPAESRHYSNPAAIEGLREAQLVASRGQVERGNLKRAQNQVTDS